MLIRCLNSGAGQITTLGDRSLALLPTNREKGQVLLASDDAGRSTRLGSGSGQINPKDCALAGRAVDGHPAFVVFDNAHDGG
jgi:hypothetical protein